MGVSSVTVRVEPDDASEKEGSGVWVSDTVFNLTLADTVFTLTLIGKDPDFPGLLLGASRRLRNKTADIFLVSLKNR
jgi:hypothetical protein